MRFWFTLACLVLVGSTIGGSVHAAEAVRPTTQTPVLIVEDATEAADCRVSIDSAPLQKCPAGSVIWVRVGRYGEVQGHQGRVYAVLGHQTPDQTQLRERLVAQLRARLRAPVRLALSCTPASRTISGQYRFSTSTPGIPYVFYTLRYQINGDCSVTAVSDQARTDYPPVRWNSSCTNGTQSCNTWRMDLTTTMSAWKGEQASSYGKEYRNNAQSGSHYAYGYWSFD